MWMLHKPPYEILNNGSECVQGLTPAKHLNPLFSAPRTNYSVNSQMYYTSHDYNSNINFLDNSILFNLICISAHYSDVIMGTIASQITSLAVVYSTIYSDGDQRKHQSSASLAFLRGIHRRPVNSPQKVPVTRKKFPFDDIIMFWFASSRKFDTFSNHQKNCLICWYLHTAFKFSCCIQQ